MGDLYEALGVASDVSPEDLRKAYKRAALRCHPDRKGGTVEDFQKLQRGFEILNDPAKRKIYDMYGEEMVGLMYEGNGNPETAMKAFARISVYQRAQLVFLFCVATSMFMLTPIFIVLRWDMFVHWPWVVCFIPLWVMHGIACVPVVLMPSPPEDMSDEEREEWDVAMSTQRTYRLAAVVIMSLLIVLEVLVALRLDGSIEWSWHAVLAPWALLEMIGAVRKIAYAGDEDGQEQGLPSVGWNLVRLAMAFTIAAKLNGDIQYWDYVFIPYYVGIAFSFMLLVRQCHSEEPTDGGPTPAMRACTGMCILFFWVIWLSLILLRLDDPEEISSFVVMLPIFIPPYLLCCCLSCCVWYVGTENVGGTDYSSSEFGDTSTEGLLDP